MQHCNIIKQKGLRKKLCVLKKLICRFRNDQEQFSINVALVRLGRDLPWIPWDRRNKLYMKKMYHYISSRYTPYLKELITIYNPSTKKVGRKTVWVMWWQGEENMPQIVQACYHQLLKVKEDYELVLISENNWHEYLDLPEYIMRKVNTGAITLTHLSDIIRWGLLYYYGGLWLDIKMFVSRFPKEQINRDFYTLRAPGIWGDTLYSGNWFGPCLYFKFSSSRFSFLMYNLFLKYWEENEQLIEYFLIDIYIDFVSSNVPEIMNQIEEVPENYHFLDLLSSMDQEYTEEMLNQIFINSDVHFLTYKKKYREYTDDHKETVYKHIVDTALSENNQ